MPFISYSYSASNDCWRRSTFCCPLFNPYNSWARFNNLCSKGLRGLDQQFMRTSKSIPWNHDTWMVYLSCEKKKLPFTLKTAFWSMLLSLLSIPTRRPLRGSASRQLRRNATTWDEDLVSLVWGIERSLERYVNAFETVYTYGIWINLAKTMHFRVSSSKQLQRMTWLSGLKRKENGSIQKRMRSVLDPAL